MPAPDTLTETAQDGAGPAGRSEGGHPTRLEHLVELLREAAERLFLSAQSLEDSHTRGDGDWTGEEMAYAEWQTDTDLATRLLLAAERVEDTRYPWRLDSDAARRALDDCRKRLAEAELYWERWQNEALSARDAPT
jgi:hypothetical protein